MDSSFVRAASRCATVLAVLEPPRGKASTLVGWRGPNRAPAQKAPRISTSAARMMRARCDVFTAVMAVVPSDPVDVNSIRKIEERFLASLGMTDLGSCRLTAKPGGESLDLAAGFLKRAGTVDFLGGETQFIPDGKLGGDAAARFTFAQATRNEALELLLRLAPGDDEAIEFFVNAGFDKERGFHKGGVARAVALPHVKLAEDDFSDARMDDGVETVELGAVVENDGAELCAVNAAIPGEYRLTEFLEDLVVGWLARFDGLGGERIGGEATKPKFAEPARNGAFAAGDSTGESESEHFS